MARNGTRRLIAVALAVGLAMPGAMTVAGAAAAVDGQTVGQSGDRTREPRMHGDDVRRVVFVGNNWDGTADLLAPGSFRRLGRINVIPDAEERLQEILANPYRAAYFLAIRALIGEGHDQYVDDMYSSNDGKLMIVSRPSFADVVAISLATRKIVWRFAVDGVRSDHMAMSPDGKRVVVSASTGNVVHVLRVSDGKALGKFASGGSPHENIFIDGGKRILHASIGMVYSPLDDPALDPTKQERVLRIVDAKTLKILRSYNLRKALDARGMTKVSSAVRPMTLSPDDKTFYFQLSFFHGFVEMDRASGKITRVKHLPNLVPDVPREQYVLDSAHHGIAMNPEGTKICVAGTMSNYATVVDARTFKRGKLLMGGRKPYWVTPSWDGASCYISWAGSNKVSKISYRTGRITQSVKVGFHPQRIRNGFIRKALVPTLPSAG